MRLRAFARRDADAMDALWAREASVAWMHSAAWTPAAEPPEGVAEFARPGIKKEKGPEREAPGLRFATPQCG